MAKGVNVGVRELARRAGCSPGLVTRKLNQGKTPAQIIQEAKVIHEARKLRAEPSQKSESFAEAQRRKEVALANLRELEEGEKRRSLLPVDDVRDAVNGMVIAFRTKCWVISDELSDKVAATSDSIACRELINARLYEALEELAEYPARA